MNVGQLLECHLGWGAAHGWDDESENSERYVPGPINVATPVFDGATDEEVAELLRRTNINLMNKARMDYGEAHARGSSSRSSTTSARRPSTTAAPASPSRARLPWARASS